jgi:hypothetical protein
MGRARDVLRARGRPARGRPGARLQCRAGRDRPPATLRGWQRAADERLWKFIVSPEHAERLDSKAHTRALVSHMERDLGTRLEWVAIDHYEIASTREAEGRPA